MITRSALVIGGTRGIGKATAQLLQQRDWIVNVTGRRDFEIGILVDVEIWDFIERIQRLHNISYDAMVFSAGDLTLRGLAAFSLPVAFYRLCNAGLLNTGASVVAISSVAALRPAKVNADYAAAKAALEHYVMTLRDERLTKEMGWRIDFVRFDLVYTDAMREIPPDTMVGRMPISPEEAARQIVEVIG